MVLDKDVPKFNYISWKAQIMQCFFYSKFVIIMGEKSACDKQCENGIKERR